LTVELICADPVWVDGIWPFARPLIKSAIDRTGLSDFDEIERDVLAGNQLLWVALSGTIEAAATTKLVNVGSHKICILVACGGKQRKRWLPLFERIENYARSEGCRAMRIIGRKGWQRVLSGYNVENIILEKALN
jgi:hypothetical protein